MSIVEQFKIQLNEDYLIHRENTWDYKSFHSKVSEIIDFSAGKNSEQVLKQYLEYCVNDNFWISIVRVDQGKIENRLLLQKNKFDLIETSYEIFCEFKNLKNLNKFDNISDKFSLREDCSIPEVQNLAELIFHYGRFSEDLAIDKRKSNLRFKNWCWDLYCGDYRRVFLYHNKTIIGFMFFETKENTMQLVLGGMHPKYSHLAYFFWTHILQKYGKSKRIKTMISAANLGVLNLYSFFGFKVGKCLIGYRRFFRE